jgi:hypothetical protein
MISCAREYMIFKWIQRKCKIGRKYYLGSGRDCGKKIEHSHVDVHYLKSESSKVKFPLGEMLYE